MPYGPLFCIIVHWCVMLWVVWWMLVRWNHQFYAVLGFCRQTNEYFQEVQGWRWSSIFSSKLTGLNYRMIKNVPVNCISDNPKFYQGTMCALNLFMLPNRMNFNVYLFYYFFLILKLRAQMPELCHSHPNAPQWWSWNQNQSSNAWVVPPWPLKANFGLWPLRPHFKLLDLKKCRLACSFSWLMQILASGSYEIASYILYFLCLFKILKTKWTKITDQILKGLLYEIHLLID